jgi:hypothetical protein
MRSAAPPNSEGSEDAFSKAWVPYSLPSDRRQKAAKKSLVCHFFCPAPHLFAIDAISNALTAQQCGDRGTIRMVANLDVAGSCSPTPPGGFARTQRTNPRRCFEQISGLLETPSNRLASCGQPIMTFLIRIDGVTVVTVGPEQNQVTCKSSPPCPDQSALRTSPNCCHEVPVQR